ncbi:MAG: carboxylating nicotinate-nucleotide diphosphorylase [Saprospiraceae bacterium]|jgi:nicotinate-nucleotide pyrophosphorylase (carboxylating)|nr:carboxylating nicotinate-nucleotide diphosphorylase [Saprospiraceae bacterium]
MPDKETMLEFIKASLYEDIREGDHTSLACIPAENTNIAHLIAKDDGVIAGVEFAEIVMKYIDPTCDFETLIKDGEDIQYGDIVFKCKAKSQALLAGERLILNVMQRMSGIATLSNRFALEVHGLPTKILDTRKTTPLNRFLEKWAVKLGGCENYRIGLYDWFMIKDNHVDACGGVKKAIKKVLDYKAKNNLDIGITVEVRNLVEIHEVLEIGKIQRIMFDNFEIPILREAVAIVGQTFETEASGGITIQNVRKYAETGVDYISVGALTHSAGTLDMSMKIRG